MKGDRNSPTGAIASVPNKKAGVDVLEIRRRAGKIGATQETFANATGIPVKTIRNWEQRRRKPSGPALTLLLLIQKNPSLVVETMNSAA